MGPLETAIEACEIYRKVAGSYIFSGCSVVVSGSMLAAPLLARADPKYGMGIPRAIEWFKKILTRTKETGSYAVAIWGMKLDKPVEIMDGYLVQPYAEAPDFPIKRRINGLTRKVGDGRVWYSTRFYDAPGAIMTRAVKDFPYRGCSDLPFKELRRLAGDTSDLLALLQASITGDPLVGASWFSYEDDEFNFNDRENHLSWHVPEVEPIVRNHVNVTAESLAAVNAALKKLPDDCREKLSRSAHRYVLSLCRHQPIDRILDLAIAFEIMTGGGKGDNAPPSWKVSVRSAQLIGGTLERRQCIREALGSLYKLRNASSHGGSPQDARLKDILATCSSIYRRLVDSVLAPGASLDWSAIELEPRTRE